MGVFTEAAPRASSLASLRVSQEDIMAMTQTSKQVYGKSYGGNAAEQYERDFVPVIGRPFAIDLVEGANLQPGERVLDVACGTGIVSRLAAERVGARGRVAGVDVNPAMLAVARSVVTGPAAMQWFETTAEAMPLPDAAFDVVFCQLALQFIPDKRAAASEIQRVLASDGRGYVSVPTPTRFFGAFEQALERRIPPAAPFVRMVFSMHDAAELERLFTSAGFGRVDVREYTKTIHLPPPADFLQEYIGCTPLAGIVADVDAGTRALLEREVADAWQPWVTEHGMTYEQGMLVATLWK
jgi:ubiquinone/menaquinone biosynthesis C-methylase UbiE